MPKKMLIIISVTLTVAVLTFCGYLYFLANRIDNDNIIRWNNQQDVNQNLIKNSPQKTGDNK